MKISVSNPQISLFESPVVETKVLTVQDLICTDVETNLNEIEVNETLLKLPTKKRGPKKEKTLNEVVLEIVKETETLKYNPLPFIDEHGTTGIKYEFETGFSDIDIDFMRFLNRLANDAALEVEALLQTRKLKKMLSKEDSKINQLKKQYEYTRELLGIETYNLYIKKQYKFEYNELLKLPVEPSELPFEMYIGVPEELL